MAVEVGRDRTDRLLWEFTALKRKGEGSNLKIVRWTLVSPHHSVSVTSSSDTGICRTVDAADRDYMREDSIMPVSRMYITMIIFQASPPRQR